jgi:Flp pilus assembly protein TadG
MIQQNDLLPKELLMITNPRRLFRQRVRPAAAAVELAMVAPLLGMLTVGMFELSRGMMAKETLCNAARKGCRTGILRQYGNSTIIDDCTNIMRDNGYDVTQFNPPVVGTITITVTDPNGHSLADALDAPPGSTVSVQVTIPVSSVMWVTSFFLTSSTLESDVMVMMKQ